MDLTLQNHDRWWLKPWYSKTLAPWKKCYDWPRQHIKKQSQYIAGKVPSSQSYCFTSGHIRVWKFDYKECWAQKDWCFLTVVLEKTLESSLDFKEIKPVNLKKSVLNIHCKAWCWIWNSSTLTTWWEELTHWKNPDSGKYRSQEEKGMTGHEMVGWHHLLDGHEFE